MNKLKKLFPIIIINLLIIGIFCGSILYTLTYTSVPISMQHLWFGNDLKTFLLYDHIITTVVMLITITALDVAWYFNLR